MLSRAAPGCACREVDKSTSLARLIRRLRAVRAWVQVQVQVQA